MAAAVAACFAGHALGATLSISSDEAVATFDNSGSAGVLQIGWEVGGVNHLAEQDFYLSIGRGGDSYTDVTPVALSSVAEESVTINDTPVVIIPGVLEIDPATIVVEYLIDEVLTTISYDLTGASTTPSQPGDSSISSIKVNVKLENLSATEEAEFRFRQYTDFNLNNTPGDLSVSVPGSGVGFLSGGGVLDNPNTVTQTDVDVIVTENFAESDGGGAVLPVPDEYAYGYQPSVLSAVMSSATLPGGLPTTLFADLAWSFGWVGTLGVAGSSTDTFEIVKDLEVQFVLGELIPTPGTASLLVLAGAAAARRRRF
ncbi:MAG: hypothetical protein AAGI30_01570 [Planctomycetota bacterium]